MVDVITRTGKGSSLTQNQLDDNFQWGVPEINTSISDTLVQADNRKAMCFNGSAAGTWSLPDASGLAPDTGDWTVLIKNITASYNLTIDLTDATDSLEGVVDGTLLILPGESVQIVWDGDNTGAGAFHAVNNPRKVQSMSATGVLAPHKNLIVSNTTATTPASQIDIAADELLLSDGSGNFLKLSSVSLSDVNFNTNASGGGTSGYANGYSNAARSSSVWAYIWVVSDGTNTYGLIDDVGTSPDLTGFSGYYYGLVAAVRDNAGTLMDFNQDNDEVNTGLKTVVSSSAATSFTSANSLLALYVPPNASLLRGLILAASSTSIASTFVVVSDTTYHFGRSEVHNPGGTTAASSSTLAIMMKTAQTVHYKVTGANMAGSLYSNGWRF